ncbi:uncharacterized protein LACBIDRAFT_307873 [Laccaria bicolor S238N-H82]|uniref:Predicted protein n=1 Tax=Laccaria bicolor (strain S238N-H82 / ATCC MYA-4686) TaxID=486041 RepID=B0DQW6_LACBS|nr:uncharacterized protein LACBIDRAFT_307873 [Laccaria bicolor S238N-H82]EDR03014.1 predicted protein [Laccaria bicolor S238N-H82]|eukprot:XP_001886437.1 predicted protein [Laccaria bicolor S238N-H82]
MYTRRTLAAWEYISKQGLSKMKQNHIHLAQGLPGHNGVISGTLSLPSLSFTPPLLSFFLFFLTAN